MTHDVDTAEGMKLAGSVLDAMVDMGLKPCFFLVAHGYTWDEGFCDAVRQAGGEIGLHGDTHDNRIAYDSPENITKRLDSCRDKIRRHGIRGFRSPSLLVSDALYSEVGKRFAWDSSVPDTDTNTLLGPRRGCATVFPFRRSGGLVLPTTMPADDRLLLMGLKGLDLVSVLRKKAQYVRETSGLCHFLTHPEPHLFGRPLLRDLYRALIEELLAEGDAWVATPSEVAAFWRESESSSLAGDSPDPGAELKGATTP
jgi:peptidoglycan/xylan/chitin deacetylase (PgdA/CDA1 family)